VLGFVLVIIVANSTFLRVQQDGFELDDELAKVDGKIIMGSDTNVSLALNTKEDQVLKVDGFFVGDIDSLALEEQGVDKKHKVTNKKTVPYQVTNQTTIQVLVYGGFGSARNSVKNVFQTVFKCAPEGSIVIREFQPKEFDLIKQSDVVIFPGGRAGKILPTIAKATNKTYENVKTQLKQSIRKGLGYIGICAGVFLCIQTRMCPFARNMSLGWGYFPHLAIGENLRKVVHSQSELQNNGTKILYANGPIGMNLVKPYSSEIRDIKVLVKSNQTGGPDLLRRRPIEGVSFPKSVSLISSHKFGKGTIVSSSIHPETLVRGTIANWTKSRPGCHSSQSQLLLNLIYIAAGHTP